MSTNQSGFIAGQAPTPGEPMPQAQMPQSQMSLPHLGGYPAPESGYPPAAQPGYPPSEGYPPAAQGGYPQAQPAWGGQYMGAPPLQAQKEPSPLTDPAALVAKLPIIAMIVLIGYAAYGLLTFIGDLVSASGAYTIGGVMVLSAFSGLIWAIVQGAGWFALLMAIKHFVDLRQATLDAAMDANDEVPEQ